MIRHADGDVVAVSHLVYNAPEGMIPRGRSADLGRVTFGVLFSSRPATGVLAKNYGYRAGDTESGLGGASMLLCCLWRILLESSSLKQSSPRKGLILLAMIGCYKIWFKLGRCCTLMVSIYPTSVLSSWLK